LVLMVKTAISSLKTKQMTAKLTTTTEQACQSNTHGAPQDSQTVVSELTTITQLTKQVSAL